MPSVEPNPLLRRLPSDVAAIVAKEWTYFRREPQFKAMAVQTVYTLVLLSVGIVLPSLRGGVWGMLPGDDLLLGVSGVLLLSLLPLLFNVWAGEGAAITLLFSLPTPRRALLLGKNVAHGTLLLGVCGVGLVAAAALSGHWESLPAAGAWVVLAAPLLLAAGNLVSIRFPHRMLVRGQRWQRGGVAAAADGSGCAYAVLYAAGLRRDVSGPAPRAGRRGLAGPLGHPDVLVRALPAPRRRLLGRPVRHPARSGRGLAAAREPEIMQKIVPGE